MNAAPCGIVANQCSVHEFIDPVFAKTSPKRSFSVIQNEHFGFVFAKTGSIISDTGAGAESRDYKLQLWLRLQLRVRPLSIYH